MQAMCTIFESDKHVNLVDLVDFVELMEHNEHEQGDHDNLISHSVKCKLFCNIFFSSRKTANWYKIFKFHSPKS